MLGLLHDVGYIHGKQNHEETGGKIMEEMNYPYAEIIQYHGTTPLLYMQTKKCTKEDIPKELILLWIADMSVDLSGNTVGFKFRLNDIGNRLGFDSVAYRNCTETVKFLESYLN